MVEAVDHKRVYILCDIDRVSTHVERFIMEWLMNVSNKLLR